MHRNSTSLALALLAPSLVLFLALTIYPLARVFALSLFATEYGFEDALFVGTENYVDLVQHRFFRTAAWNTLVFAILATLSEVGIGLVLALSRVRPDPGRPDRGSRPADALRALDHGGHRDLARVVSL